jgi:hypothetical protein
MVRQELDARKSGGTAAAVRYTLETDKGVKPEADAGDGSDYSTPRWSG